MKLTNNQIELLNNHIENGLISKKEHSTAPLNIYKYTKQTQYSQKWDEMTKMCRGLILDDDYNIVARPFGKFFNLEEHDLSELPNEPYKIYDKLDGSLGILYWFDDTPYIATCGSFHSEQAQWATSLLHKKYKNCFGQFNKDYTYLFEIIYPENKIVVDYGGLKDIILLGAIDIVSGLDIPLIALDVDLPKVKEYDYTVNITELKSLGEKNTEGFVVKYESGFRVKLKLEEYVRLHYIMSNTSSITIWETLKDGKPLDEILERVPDEFYNWVKYTEANLRKEYDGILNDALAIYRNLDLTKSRKDLALEIANYPQKHLVFSLLSGYSLDDQIWKMLRPEYNRPFTVGE